MKNKIGKFAQMFDSPNELHMFASAVSIITADGRNIVGNMRGFDQCVNVILDECHERVYSTDCGVEQVVLGLYIVRGDNM